jgi:hypothetical protein
LDRLAEADRRFDEAEPAIGHVPGEKGEAFAEKLRWQDWVGLAYSDRDVAQRSLIRAILTWNGADRSKVKHAERHVFAPCGITLGGRTYLAIPDPDTNRELKPGDTIDPGEPYLTVLVVLDAGAIVDLGTADAAEMKGGAR